MADKKTLAAIYEGDDAKRQARLNRVRKLAALTKPWVLPPLGQTGDAQLPDSYQSVGSTGVSAMVGKMMLALWTPGTPWFQTKLSPAIQFSPNISDDEKRSAAQTLLSHDLALMAMLESNKVSSHMRTPSTFRSRKRTSVEQVIVTGDSLERMHDDFRIQVFRADQYVTNRDSAGDVRYHITCEEVDPLALAIDGLDNDEILALIGLEKNDYAEKGVDDRCIKLFTRVEWHPETKKWVIEQEAEKVVFNTSEETVTPYFSTALNLVPGENYGRGKVEENLGSLNGLDTTELRVLEIAARMAAGLIVLDNNSLMREDDLTKPPGSVIRGDVKDGVCRDVGTVSFNEHRQFRELMESIKGKEAQLGRAFLLETSSQPQGERVTATQVRRVAAEIDAALGGEFAPFADQQQIPTLMRALHLARRKNLLPTLPDNAVQVEVVTGIAALTRDIEFQKLLDLTTIWAQLPEPAQNRIGYSVIAEKLAELRAFYAPGVVKTDKQIAQEQQAAINANLANKAGETAIDAAGGIAQEAAKQAGQVNQGG